MTHSAIISHLYSHFAEYRTVWNHQREACEELGALVFLPGNDLEWAWWSLADIRDYIRQGGLNDEELVGELNDSEVGDDFLVLVIEQVGGPGRQKGHFHRMSKIKMN